MTVLLPASAAFPSAAVALLSLLWLAFLLLQQSMCLHVLAKEEEDLLNGLVPQ